MFGFRRDRRYVEKSRNPERQCAIEIVGSAGQIRGYLFDLTKRAVRIILPKDYLPLFATRSSENFSLKLTFFKKDIEVGMSHIMRIDTDMPDESICIVFEFQQVDEASRKVIESIVDLLGEDPE